MCKWSYQVRSAVCEFQAQQRSWSKGINLGRTGAPLVKTEEDFWILSPSERKRNQTSISVLIGNYISIRVDWRICVGVCPARQIKTKDVHVWREKFRIVSKITHL